MGLTDRQAADTLANKEAAAALTTDSTSMLRAEAVLAPAESREYEMPDQLPPQVVWGGAILVVFVTLWGIAVFSATASEPLAHGGDAVAAIATLAGLAATYFALRQLELQRHANAAQQEMVTRQLELQRVANDEQKAQLERQISAQARHLQEDHRLRRVAELRERWATYIEAIGSAIHGIARTDGLVTDAKGGSLNSDVAWDVIKTARSAIDRCHIAHYALLLVDRSEERTTESARALALVEAAREALATKARIDFVGLGEGLVQLLVNTRASLDKELAASQ